MGPACILCQRKTLEAKDHTAECLVTPEGVINNDEKAAAWRAGVAAAKLVQRIKEAK